MVVRLDGSDRETQKVRLAAHPLPDGEVLVIGRNIDEIEGLPKSSGGRFGWACCRLSGWRSSSAWC